MDCPLAVMLLLQRKHIKLTTIRTFQHITRRMSLKFCTKHVNYNGTIQIVLHSMYGQQKPNDSTPLSETSHTHSTLPGQLLNKTLHNYSTLAACHIPYNRRLQRPNLQGRPFWKRTMSTRPEVWVTTIR